MYMSSNELEVDGLYC